MRKLFHFIKWVLLVLVGAVVLALLSPFLLEELGYYALQPGWAVAEQLVEEGKGVGECRKIMRVCWDVLSPPTVQQRMTCRYRYAEPTKDPTACTGLLPTEYGLDCVGNIWGPLIDESNCHWYKDNAVRCFEEPNLTPHIYDCTAKESGVLIDECKHRLAFKQKNLEMCEPITNAVLRSICKVRIQAWKEYPQLRSTIYFNDNIE